MIVLLFLLVFLLTPFLMLELVDTLIGKIMEAFDAGFN